MSWEDWLTFFAAVITFLAVAVSLQNSPKWVPGMPSFVPTTLAGLLIGMIAARIRYYAAIDPPGRAAARRDRRRAGRPELRGWR
jgi:hypothetical protein